MFEKIQKKIESVRNEPEHIRVRYLVGSVVLSMVVVLFLWMFSIHEGVRGISKDAPRLKESIGGSKEKTIKEISDPSIKKEQEESAEMYFQSEIGRGR